MIAKRLNEILDRTTISWHGHTMDVLREIERLAENVDLKLDIGNAISAGQRGEEMFARDYLNKARLRAENLKV